MQKNYVVLLEHGLDVGADVLAERLPWDAFAAFGLELAVEFLGVFGGCHRRFETFEGLRVDAGALVGSAEDFVELLVLLVPLFVEVAGLAVGRA